MNRFAFGVNGNDWVNGKVWETKGKAVPLKIVPNFNPNQNAIKDFYEDLKCPINVTSHRSSIC